MVHGRNELPQNQVSRWYLYLSQLWQPMPLMIWLSIFVLLVVKAYIDAIILLALNFANATLAYWELRRAGDALISLKSSLKPLAVCKRDGIWREIDASELCPGDLISLAPGRNVPADARLRSSIGVDQSCLTGESLPVNMYRNDLVLMGSSVVRGLSEAVVQSTGKNSYFGKTASLLESQKHSSNLNNFLRTNVNLRQALHFIVVLLVASIPLAIEIISTTTLALGAYEVANHGIICTRFSALEDLACLNILCCDKTGTLTANKMTLQKETPVYVEGEDQESLLKYASMSTHWEEPGNDPLDALILKNVNRDLLQHVHQLEVVPFDPVIKRTEATIQERENGHQRVFRVAKGSPHVILKLCKENISKSQRIEHDVKSLGRRGIRCLAVARTGRNGWQFLGMLCFIDPPRPDTKETIAEAKRLGIHVKMITGDHLLIAREMANFLGMRKERFAEVFPEHKYLIVECLRDLGYKVGMTGDGVNDAPALKAADVGIAVKGSTDAAKAAADIILTEPGLGTIIEGLLVARQTFARIRSFMVYRIAATLQLLFFFFIAAFAFTFFSLPVLLMLLITVLNDGTLISIAYDSAVPSESPEHWDFTDLFVISSMLAMIACVSSLLVLYILLDRPAGLSYGQITTGIFLKVAVSDFLTLFNARTGKLSVFCAPSPSLLLLIAAGVSLLISTALAMSFPIMEIDEPYILPLLIWAICLVFFLIQDLLKVATFLVLRSCRSCSIGVSEPSTPCDADTDTRPHRQQIKQRGTLMRPMHAVDTDCEESDSKRLQHGDYEKSDSAREFDTDIGYV
eukprot:GSChrysophyteH1.ASY1.ANO1.2377.1 assembled CDS